MNNTGTFSKLSPERLLRQLTNSSDTTCLQVSHNSVLWSIYLEQGKIIYATHSVEPFDRLERHIRRLNQQISPLTNEVRVQLRLTFEPDWQTQLSKPEYDLLSEPPEYQGIHWLVTQKHLPSHQAALLIQELVKEVIESFMLMKEATYVLTERVKSLPKLCKLDTENIIDICQKRLQSWQSCAPQISSPYQRPYLLINSRFYNKQLPELQQNMTTWMKGFSLRHLAVIMNVDEVELARTLYPYILQGSVILHEPDPPFDQLPKTFEDVSISSTYSTLVINEEESDVEALADDNPAVENHVPEISTLRTENHKQLNILNNIEAENETVNTTTISPKETYKIISVDDSPTILKEISRCLEGENVAVVTINDPIKAVMSIIRHKPDLILLDLNMAGIDGYELCKIIRNNSMFQEIPIIFVTGSKGIVDKVKARMVGASGYLTKPFTPTELVKMIFMHLA
ncbi:response regulator [Trichormus azollae]|jgi:twitching motility two-component system response regulator PilG|uniref:Protein PatA n=1 Tax=Nostoc azollae (strain 0708) TaxID=551115 RepID=D7E1V4_NOSA0|nr:response regulator [Trichormus azollae]ADI64875.1 response regulator receiver protein ['Nostoc azollae' 0708]